MEVKPDVRYLKDMAEVLCDKKWAKRAGNFPVYYMYRGIKRKNGLRYDITLTPAQMLGQEFAKTKGHNHYDNYGELYITLKGKAIYLLQKYQNNKVEDVYAVNASKGDVIIIPPQYGHVTINPSKKEELKTANWLDEKSQHDYDVIGKKQGACYYYLKSGWVKNKNYQEIPKLRFEKPLKKVPKDLSFLRG